MKTIVVGYDDTDSAKDALSRAAEMAEAFGAKPIVISVAPALVPAGRGIGPIDPTDTPDEHREQLKHAAALLEERGIEAEYEVALGDPGDWIVELADRREADLIVVGSSERGLISRLLGLSVSGRVQRKAHCDVLIVH
jgi:nucleotide-binding universal stress UspA family protein